MRTLALLVAFSGLGALSAAAQGGARGPSFTLHAVRTSAVAVDGHVRRYLGEDPFPPFREEADAGAGVGVRIGFAPHALVELYAALDVTRHAAALPGSEGEHTLGQFGFGARVQPPRTRLPLSPYLQAGIGKRNLSGTLRREWPLPGRQSITGDVATAGGGVRAFLGGALALDVGVERGWGGFDRIELQETYTPEMESGAATRLTTVRAGLAWLPRPR